MQHVPIHRIKTATSESRQHDMPILGDHIRGLGDCRVEHQLRGRSTYPELPRPYREHDFEYEGQGERNSKLLRRVGIRSTAVLAQEPFVVSMVV